MCNRSRTYYISYTFCRRTPANFYENTDKKHRNRDLSSCPLSLIPLEYFDFVKDVVFDTMHLIYLVE